MLIELSATDKATKAARNRVAFLAVLDEVRVELENNWPAKQIWKALVINGKIDICYTTFLKYLDVFIFRPRRFNITTDEPNSLINKMLARKSTRVANDQSEPPEGTEVRKNSVSSWGKTPARTDHKKLSEIPNIGGGNQIDPSSLF